MLSQLVVVVLQEMVQLVHQMDKIQYLALHQAQEYLPHLQQKVVVEVDTIHQIQQDQVVVKVVQVEAQVYTKAVAL